MSEVDAINLHPSHRWVMVPYMYEAGDPLLCSRCLRPDNSVWAELKCDEEVKP